VSRYEIWKFLHVVAAMVWTGGSVVFLVLSARAGASKDPAEMGRTGQLALWTGTRIFAPASVFVLILGIVMILDGPWEFSDPWIGLGLLGVIVTAGIGNGFLAPNGRKIGPAMMERGPQDPVTQRLVSRQRLFSILNTVLLVAVVFDMVVKPGS
jgi:uncharacterized membrane protein